MLNYFNSTALIIRIRAIIAGKSGKETFLNVSAAVLLLSVTCLGFWMRCHRLAADPPYWSYVFNTDEGHYSYNTCNKIQYGQWFVNDAKYSLVTPLFGLCQYYSAALAVRAPMIVKIRLISVLSGILSCLLLVFFIGGRFAKTAAAALWAISFMGIVHSRLGIPDMMLACAIQITFLTAITAYSRASTPLNILSGLFAVSTIAIKPSGAVVFPVLLFLPLLYRGTRENFRKYFIGISAGLFIGAFLFLLLVILPNRNDWGKIVAAAMAFGRDSVRLNPFAAVRSLYGFILSPALQTMPFLWPLSLMWCVAEFAPKLTRKENDFNDTVLFLWLLSGIAALGIPSYQPARWQVILFPPVIIAGIKMLQNHSGLKPAIISFGVSACISIQYAILQGHSFLKMHGTVHPENGIFGNAFLLLAVIAAFIFVFVIVKNVKSSRTKAVLWAVVFCEISIQLLFNRALLYPSFKNQSQWINFSKHMEALTRGKNDIISGDAVQMLPLYANVNVMPVFYLLNADGAGLDTRLRDFFISKSRLPAYYLLVDFNYDKYVKDAPAFMNCLEVTGSCKLLIGGVGIHEVYIGRFRSYEWLKSAPAKLPSR